MRQVKRGHSKISHLERTIKHHRLGDKVSSRPWPVVKGIKKDLLQHLVGGGVGIYGQRLIAVDGAEATTVIHPHDMIRMRMRHQDRINLSNSFPKTLDSKLRSGIHHQLDVIGFNIDGGTSAMILGVGQELWRILLTDNGHPLRGAGSQENQIERHRRITYQRPPGGNKSPEIFFAQDSRDRQHVPMLATLRIKNLALVSDLCLELESGLNVITGETGAGKSVIIGALSLILGQRADRGLIRSGEEVCVVEAVFSLAPASKNIPAFLEENGLEPCESHQLVIKRSFHLNGTNRQFVNGSPTTLAALSTLGQSLVDMHGPHDHQSLLSTSRQLNMLDAFGHLEAPRQLFADLLSELNRLKQGLGELAVDERTYAQQLDLLRFQAQEIQGARLQPGEEGPLQEAFQRASNASRLTELTRTAVDLLSDGENSALSAAAQLGRTLQEFQRLDPQAQELLAIHEQASQSLQELSTALSRYADRLEVDPQQLAELEERIGLIQSLKRKYGGTVDEVIAFGENAAEKLRKLEGREAEVARIRAEMARVEAKLWQAGQELSGQRRKVAPKLAKEISKQLNELGFRQSQFAVTLQTQAAGEGQSAFRGQGLDELEFLFAPNPGEPQHPLRQIASSGEMARVMLAIKTVLAAQDDVPVLVFDEVDANVGGETAQVVGLKMSQIAKDRQVLCITHLAPVAASARAHYVVSKCVKNGRTWSAIDRLDRPARVTELARMLGGQSNAARQHAEALLQE
jgi:DNA repair protein RecN (Recombination protein N)